MNFIAKLLLVLLTLASLQSCNDSSTSNSINSDNPTDYIESKGFQGSILFKKADEDLVRSGFGWADKENQILNEMDTHFRIGSMSKAFTAMGILQLKREGLIAHLDQTLADFAPEFPFSDQVTLLHLLTHRSGLPDHTGAFEALFEQQSSNLTPDEIVDIYADAISEEGLLFEPGSQFNYSNANYLLLALLIESLSEQAYELYIKNKILNPNGMQETYLGDDEITGVMEARGYHGNELVGSYPMSVAFGSGSWVSTVSDMEKWGNAWMNGLLTAEEFEEVFPEVTDEYTKIGLGWFAVKIENQLTYFHGGDIDGFTSIIALFPNQDGLLVALSNQEDKRMQLDQMMEDFVKMSLTE